jgi:5-hydroxyisourate hydrolase-like protein (transthyretin family)
MYRIFSFILLFFMPCSVLTVNAGHSAAPGFPAIEIFEGASGTADIVAVITVVNQPAGSTAGRPIEGVSVISPPTVIIEDLFGVPQEMISITVSLSSGNFSPGSTVTVFTDSQGMAVYDNLVIDDPGSGYQMIFSTGTAVVDDVISLEFDIHAQAGEMSVSSHPLESIAGYPVAGPPTVYLENGGLSLEGVSVTAYLSKNDFITGSSVTVVTDASGMAVFDNLIIDTSEPGYTIYFSADTDGIAKADSDLFTVTEEVAILSIQQQPALTIAGERVNGIPSVRIVNKISGNPIPSINIYASLSKNGFATGSTTMATTNASGLASFGNLVIDNADTDYQLVFSTGSSGVADILSDPFEIIPVNGTISVSTQPSETIAGYLVEGPPVVTVLDNLGDPVVGLEVSAVVNINSFNPGSTVSVLTDESGVAAFDNLILDVVDDDYVIVFSTAIGEGIPPVSSVPFNVVAELAVLTITQQPQLTIEGEKINGVPTARLLSMGGLPVQGAAITATLSDTGFSPGSTVTVVTNASGYAVFDNLIADVAGTGFQIYFSTGTSGVAGIFSEAFDVSMPAGIMTITRQPLETVIGHPVVGTPEITITQPGGEAWTGDEVTVNVTVNKNGFSSGTFSRLTTGGVARFDDLIINTVANGYSLIFTVDVNDGIANKTSDLFNVVAVAGILEVSGQPAESVTGDPVKGPPTVRLTNTSGNPVPGVLVTVSLNKSSFAAGSTLSATTGATGYATFGNLFIDEFDTGYQLTFNAGASGVADAVSNIFEVTDVTLSMDVTTQPSASIAGEPVAGVPAVTITDSEGGIAGITVTAILNGGSFAPGSTLTTVTGPTGEAVFPLLYVEQAGEGYTITFSADWPGVNNTQSAGFSVVAADPATILVNVQPSGSIAGQIITGFPTATVYDQFGNPIGGVTVNAEPNQHAAHFTGTTGKITGPDGVAVFDDLILTRSAPDYVLLFTAPGVTSGTSLNFTVASATPASITVHTQPSETVAGAAISGPPVVSVADEYGNPVHGEMITVSEEGGYSIDGGTLHVETTSAGMAEFTNLVIGTEGFYRLRFSAGALDQLSASFNVVAGTIFTRFNGGSHSGFFSAVDNGVVLGQKPHRIEILTQPGESIVGSEIEGPLRIAVFDELDNPVPDISVTLSGVAFSSGSTTLSSDSSGEIVFGSLVIDVPGNYVITCTVDEDPSITAQTASFEVINTLAHLTVEAAPTHSVAGQSISGFPVVSLKNTIGMPVPGVDITVYINQHSFASGTVTATTDENGLAGFSNLVLNTAAVNYQLIFDADLSGVLNISSGNFEVVNAPASNMHMVTQPRETSEQSAIEGPPAVMVTDEYGNPVGGISVTVSANGGSLDAGTTVVTTGANGIANFTNLIINTAGHYGLSFSASGTGGLESVGFQVISGTFSNRFRGGSHSGFKLDESMGQLLGQTPVRMSFTSQPQETVAGFIVEGSPRVAVYDETDNPVAGVQVSVSLITGSFSSGSVSGITNSQGEITFGNLVIDTPGSYRLLIRADNHTATINDIESVVFDVVSQTYIMQVESEPLSSIAGQHVSGPPVVSITNFIYQPLTGVYVTVHLNQNGFASGTQTVQTDDFGEAVFDDLIIETSGEGYQLIFDASYPGISNLNSGLFNVANAPPSLISINGQPQTTMEGAVISGSPSVSVTDQFGNPVSGVDVTVSESAGNTFEAGTLTRTTGAGGMAYFNDLIIGSYGTYSLTFSVDGIDDVVSSSFIVMSGTVENRFRGGSHSGFDVDDTGDAKLGQTPVRIQITGQPSETVAGEIITGPPSIMVYDEMDNPMAGIEITVTGATFDQGMVTLVTDNFGEAVFSDLIIEATGTYQLTFSGNGALYPLLADAVSSTFEVVDPQLFMTIITQPSETVAGETIAGPPAIHISNGIGQGFAGVEVSVWLNQNDFSSGAASQSVTTDDGGMAVFDELIIDRAAQGYQLIFNAAYGGVASIVSNTFTVVNAVAHGITVSSQPEAAEAGAVIGGSPGVIVTDEFGNPVPSATVSVTETGGASFSSGTLSLVTGAAGTVAFDDLIINSPGTYTLSFAVTGIESAVSASFMVLSGEIINRFRGGSHSGFVSEQEQTRLGQTPSRIGINIQPVETVVGFEIGGPVTVTVYDELDNPVPGIDVLANVSGAFSAGSSDMLASGADGSVVFDNLIIGTTGTYTLTFTAPGFPMVPEAASVSFEVINQVLTMVMQIQPGETVAGQAISGSPSVYIRNSVMQPVQGIDITVILNQNEFSSDPATLTATTDVSGLAVFDQLVVDLAASGYQLIFDAQHPGIGNIISVPFDVVPAAPDHMIMVTQPANSVAGSVIGGPPSVSVADAFGNVLTGIQVTVSEAGGEPFGSGTLSGATGAGGIVSFDDLTINNAGEYRLAFSVDGINSMESGMFRIMSGTVYPRYRGVSHSGFISGLIEDQVLADGTCAAEMFLESADVLVCEGEIIQLRVEFIGEAPYTFRYSNGFEEFIVETSMNPHFIDVPAVWSGTTPVITYNFSITDVTDNRGCSVPGEGGAVIEVYKIPSSGPVFHIPNNFE